MLIRQIDTQSKSERNRFIHLPFDLYRENPLWVPPILIDAHTQLRRDQHPFYEHSEADFFLAERDGQVVGRVAALVNNRYNEYHKTRQAQFYLFECIEDLEVAKALMGEVEKWAKQRDLDTIVGPKGFGALDGYGMLVKGFEFRPAMTMMNYNPPYYPQFMEAMGFKKEVDFVSCYLPADKFRLEERVHRIAQRAARRSGLEVKRFGNKRELVAMAPQIGRAYNQAFVNNWEYYPLTDHEIKFLTDNIMMIANPKLFKIIMHGDDVVGFLFGFPDVSAALQASKGRLFPLGIIRILWEFRRTKWLALNGAGILPEFHGRGGNALLYSEMEKTIHESGFLHADLTQVAETAVQMRRDLENVGGVAYKNHRVFRKHI